VNLVSEIRLLVFVMPRPLGGTLSDDDVWRLSLTYIGPKSKTERPRKTKIGAEVANITHDSDTTFKVKRSRSQGRGQYCGGILHSLFTLSQCSSKHPEFIGLLGYTMPWGLLTLGVGCQVTRFTFVFTPTHRGCLDKSHGVGRAVGIGAYVRHV